jgi:hypothetical protein
VRENDLSAGALDVLIGEWSIEPQFHEMPAPSGARATFEWMSGGQFLIQRWTVPVPEAPDGVAIIGADPARPGAYLQHYFDTRGVARVYRMTFDNNSWSLLRDEVDFSPLEFKQRYSGTVSDDGRTISGMWEICHDGSTWQRDFELWYRKLS